MKRRKIFINHHPPRDTNLLLFDIQRALLYGFHIVLVNGVSVCMLKPSKHAFITLTIHTPVLFHPYHKQQNMYVNKYSQEIDMSNPLKYIINLRWQTFSYRISHANLVY